MTRLEQESIERWWHEQSALVNALRREGVAAYVAEHADGIVPTFQIHDRSCRCIDEGTPGGVHLAGAGCLLPREQALAIVKEANVDGIYSHAGCGAAARAAKEKGIPPEGVEQLAKDEARALAEAAGVPYLGHIEKRELQRPAETHVARVVYYDGTGHFDPSRSSVLPKGFVVSRRYLPLEYAKEETNVAISIATGEHGFGNRITAEEPFLVIVVGDPHDPLYSVHALQEEVMDLVNGLDGRVVIHGMHAIEADMEVSASV